MSDGTGTGPELLSLIVLGVAALGLATVAFFWSKGRKIPGDHVFRASRMSRGNLWFPTQVAVTPTSVVHYTPELVGGREHSMHISHIASVLIDRNLFFSDVPNGGVYLLGRSGEVTLAYARRRGIGNPKRAGQRNVRAAMAHREL